MAWTRRAGEGLLSAAVGSGSPSQAAPAARLVPLVPFQASVALLWATRWTR